MARYHVVNNTPGVFSTSSPNSQAIVSNDVVFCSGQLPVDNSGALIQGSMQDKTRRCLESLSAVLRHAGSELNLALKVSVFMIDLDNFKSMNEEYSKWFGSTRQPARTCVGVRELPRGAEVEMECVAQLSSSRAKI